MKSYYSLLIEVEAPEKTMPLGMDSPMRNSVHLALSKSWPQAKITDTSSGWGLNKTGYDKMVSTSCQCVNNIGIDEVERR